jgi:putative transposase
MPNYRRWRVDGGTYFFTLVTYDRRPLLRSPEAVAALRRATAVERALHPFEFDAGVVLHDHAHFLWTLPPGDCDYSSRIGRIKVAFTKALRAAGGWERDGREAGGQCPPYSDRGRERRPQPQRGYAEVWQPRFWEHVIRDLDDRNRHLNYIHYNPVRHGYVTCPHQWEYSSFGQWVENEGYERDWCCACGGRQVVVPDFSDIAERIGE